MYAREKQILRAIHKRDGPAIDSEIPSVQDVFWVLRCGQVKIYWDPFLPAPVFLKEPRGLSLKETLAEVTSY